MLRSDGLLCPLGIARRVDVEKRIPSVTYRKIDRLRPDRTDPGFSLALTRLQELVQTGRLCHGPQAADTMNAAETLGHRRRARLRPRAGAE